MHSPSVPTFKAHKNVGANTRTQNLERVSYFSPVSDTESFTPEHPSPISDNEIEECINEITEDFNFIYDTLQRKQEKVVPKTNQIKQKQRVNIETNNRYLNDQIDISIDIPDTRRVSPIRHYIKRDVNIDFRDPINNIKFDQINEDVYGLRQSEQISRVYENQYGLRGQTPTESIDYKYKNREPYDIRRHHYIPIIHSPVQSERYDKAYAEKDNGQIYQRKLARVLKDFLALATKELSVKKGDLVLINRDVNSKWVEVEDCYSGLVGLVPRNILDMEQEGKAKAKFDFNARTPAEISFKKDEKLTLLRRVDDNWYEGVNGKLEVGIFPSSYVEAIKQPLERVVF